MKVRGRTYKVFFMFPGTNKPDVEYRIWAVTSVEAAEIARKAGKIPDDVPYGALPITRWSTRRSSS